MRILIINGNPDIEFHQFDRYLTDLSRLLQERGMQIKEIKLREIRINHCIGCWDCWVKTPGICVHKDEMVSIYPQIIECDLLLLTSPIIMGMPSGILKCFQDRMIPLIHPYIRLINKECHHWKRYSHYPLLGLLWQPQEDTDGEDIEIISDIYRRTAINFHSRIAVNVLTTQPIEEVANEITRI